MHPGGRNIFIFTYVHIHILKMFFVVILLLVGRVGFSNWLLFQKQ